MRNLLVLLLCGFLVGCQAPAEDDRLGAVDDFQLTERSGQPLGLAHLKGKVWVASFFFSRCAGPCTQVMGSMAQLQGATAGLKDGVLLVSFTVDPEHDTPEVLGKYAERYQAEKERWFFVTGPQDSVYRLVKDSFKLGVAQNEGKERTPGNEVLHSTRLVLVDRQGEKRGYYDATDPDKLAQLRKKIAVLVREKP